MGLLQFVVSEEIFNENAMPAPSMTLVQLARGAIPMPLPRLRTFGYILGHLNGAAPLAKEVLGLWVLLSVK